MIKIHLFCHKTYKEPENYNPYPLNLDEDYDINKLNININLNINKRLYLGGWHVTYQDKLEGVFPFDQTYTLDKDDDSNITIEFSPVHYVYFLMIKLGLSSFFNAKKIMLNFKVEENEVQIKRTSDSNLVNIIVTGSKIPATTILNKNYSVSELKKVLEKMKRENNEKLFIESIK